MNGKGQSVAKGSKKDWVHAMGHDRPTTFLSPRGSAKENMEGLRKMEGKEEGYTNGKQRASDQLIHLFDLNTRNSAKEKKKVSSHDS